MKIEELIARGSVKPEEETGFLITAINNFVANESISNADNVYNLFMDMYRSVDKQGRPLIDLIDFMRQYEVNASIFTDSQRDHYIHSVNVFILGLRIYASNRKFRDHFSKVYGKGRFGSEEELFLFLWGNAALFHDIGYPMEISHNQARAFARSLSDLGVRDHETQIMLQVDPLADIISLEDYPCPFSNVLDLQIRGSEGIGGARYPDVEECIRNYPRYMIENRFSDHAFYSSVIVARCYAFLAVKDDNMAEVFNEHIPTVCAAILMHNMYPHSLVKRRGLDPMNVDDSPLSYLLILCDELQEWNRKGYGFSVNKRLHPKTSGIVVDDERFFMNYRFDEGAISQLDMSSKVERIERYVNVSQIFPGGLAITCSRSNLADDLLSNREVFIDVGVPRPIVENILDIAKSIHRFYNENRSKEDGEKELEYPEWDSLTQDLKYSNMDQAMDIPRKLRAIGCHLERGEGGLDRFTDEEIARLAVIEHERWINEKVSNGWIYGKTKDVEHRISPYLVPWDDLPEDIRKRDYETAVNIIPILRSIGFRVVRDSLNSSE